VCLPEEGRGGILVRCAPVVHHPAQALAQRTRSTLHHGPIRPCASLCCRCALVALICTAHSPKPLCPHRPHLHCTFPKAALPSPPHRDLRPYHPFCTADLPGHLRPHRCRDGVQLGSQPPHQRLRGRGLHGPPARAEAAAGGGCSRART